MKYEMTDVAMVIVVWGFIISCMVMLCYLPAHLKAESECLRLGYPKSTVDYKFDAYCMNLEGTITIEVESLND